MEPTEVSNTDLSEHKQLPLSSWIADDKAAPVVDLQLMKGGLRLAGYLERAFRMAGSDERQ